MIDRMIGQDMMIGIPEQPHDQKLKLGEWQASALEKDLMTNSENDWQGKRLSKNDKEQL